MIKKGRHQTHGGNSVNSQPIFKLFFTFRFSSIFAAKCVLKISPHLIRVATLLYVTLMSDYEQLPQTNALHPPFNGLFSGTTRLSRYQKGKTNPDFTEARDSEWQWHRLGHMQVCTSLQTDNHASTPPLKVFYRPDALPATQPTASKHW